MRAFLEAAARVGWAEPARRGGLMKVGRQVLDPVLMAADFPGVSEPVRALRGLLAKALEGPTSVCAALPPAIGAAEAARRLGGRAELETVWVLAARFAIAVRYFSERLEPMLAVAEVPSGRLRPDLVPSVLAAAGARGRAAASPTGSDLAPAMAALRDAAEEAAERATCEAEAEVTAARAARRGLLSQYFAGVDAELAREERRIYYHLYYFDRQERLRARREAEQAERESLLKVEDRYYRVETTIRATGLGYLGLPQYRREARRLCGLTGGVL